MIFVRTVGGRSRWVNADRGNAQPRRPADDATQYRQASAARTRIPDLRKIAGFVTHERHRVVMQRGDHDAPEPTGGTPPALPVEHLNQHAFGLHVVMLMVRALQRDVAGFVA